MGLCVLYNMDIIDDDEFDMYYDNVDNHVSVNGVDLAVGNVRNSSSNTKRQRPKKYIFYPTPPGYCKFHPTPKGCVNKQCTRIHDTVYKQVLKEYNPAYICHDFVYTGDCKSPNCNQDHIDALRRAYIECLEYAKTQRKEEGEIKPRPLKKPKLDVDTVLDELLYIRKQIDTLIDKIQ